MPIADGVKSNLLISAYLNLKSEVSQKIPTYFKKGYSGVSG